jgi:hypothetical protein
MIINENRIEVIKQLVIDKKIKKTGEKGEKVEEIRQELVQRYPEEMILVQDILAVVEFILQNNLHKKFFGNCKCF